MTTDTTAGLELARNLLEDAKQGFVKGAHFHSGGLCPMHQEMADDYTAAIAAVTDAAAEIRGLQAERDALAARERACPTMQEAEARALVRALQEIAASVGLGQEASPADVVAAVKALAARLAVPADAQPIDTIQYWLDAYSDRASGEHFQGHGKVVQMLGEYLRLREAIAAAPQPTAAEPLTDEGDTALAVGNLIFAIDRWKGTSPATAPPAFDALLRACAGLIHSACAEPARQPLTPGQARCASGGIVGRRCAEYRPDTGRCGMPAGEQCKHQEGGAA